LEALVRDIDGKFQKHYVWNQRVCRLEKMKTAVLEHLKGEVGLNPEAQMLAVTRSSWGTLVIGVSGLQAQPAAKCHAVFCHTLSIQDNEPEQPYVVC
jgi:hypothetical protein